MHRGRDGSARRVSYISRLISISSWRECRRVFLDLNRSLQNVFHIALPADQALMRKDEARGAELIVLGTPVLVPITLEPRLAENAPEPARREVRFEVRLLIERGVSSADRDALGAHGLDELGASEAVEMGRVIADAEAVIVLPGRFGVMLLGHEPRDACQALPQVSGILFPARGDILEPRHLRHQDGGCEIADAVLRPAQRIPAAFQIGAEIPEAIRL